MIFILVPPVFLELTRARNSATKNVITGSTGRHNTQSRIAHAQQKINHAYVCQWRLVHVIVPFVKVVIEKVDDRNAERIMRTEILDRFVIK